MNRRNVVEKIENAVASWIGVRRAGIALSGGADSVALLLAAKACGGDVVALHCNFSLRGDESDGDTEFCRELCDRLGVQLLVERFETMSQKFGGESVEMACRRLRYDWFERMAAELSLSNVALAHHCGDQEETIMLNLLRGSGPRGLAGMPTRRGVFIRPLLPFSRADILSYLEAKGQAYRTDSTNLANDYRRNALRNVIIPAIRQYFPDSMKGVEATRTAMRESAKALDLLAELLFKRYVEVDSAGRWHVDISSLKELSDSSAAMYELSRHPAIDCPLNVSVIAAMMRCKGGETRRFKCDNGRMVSLKDGILTEYSINTETDFEKLTDDDSFSVAVIGIEDFVLNETELPGKKCVYFDADEIGSIDELTLRHWRPGDRLYPFGMKGSRKVSDIFSDLHYGDLEKAQARLLCRGDEILWVLGVRSSRRYKVTDATRCVLRIAMK